MKQSQYYVAEFIFSKDIPKLVENVLIDEFVDRREIAIEQLNGCYDTWNREFDAIHPELDGYSLEYTNFIAAKQQPALDNANQAKIGLNLVQLESDLENYANIYGYCTYLNTKIELTLKQGTEA